MLLVIEVTESSLRHDRDVKLSLYARHGVPEVWLIDVADRVLHVFRDPTPESGYGSESSPSDLAALRPAALADVVIDLSALF